MKHLYGLLVCTTILLGGCATKVTSMVDDKDTGLEPNYGYALLGLDTNRDLYQIYLDGAESIRLTSADLAEGDSYIITKLPAGEYSISRLFVSSRAWISFKDEANFKFEVKPGKISYVGHLEIVTRGYYKSTSHLQFDNRSSQALSYMEENFPNLLSKRSIYYGGPGEDGFFDYVYKQGFVK